MATNESSLLEFFDRMRDKGLALLSKETPDRDTYADGFANGYWQAYAEARIEFQRNDR